MEPLLRCGLLGLVGFAVGCASRGNPVLEVSQNAPLALEGMVVDAATGQSVTGGTVRLVMLSARDSSRSQVLDPSGRFAFPGLRAGRYLLDTRRIGYARRLDTLVLSTPPGLGVRLSLRAIRVCFDGCPADSAVVAAAREQMSRWQCDRDRASVATARAHWADILDDTLVARPLGVRGNSAAIAKRLRRVTRDEDCRRIARLVPEPTGLAFTIFQLGEYWLVSQSQFVNPIAFDATLEPVLSFAGVARWVRQKTGTPNK